MEMALAALALAAVVLAYGVAAVFVLSGVDDIMHSVLYWSLVVRRRWAARHGPRLTLERLEAREQQRIAVIIPTWREGGVIGRMLRHTRESVRYRNYDLFIGTYPNDPATQAEVLRTAQLFPRVHMVVSPSPGPTTKAQNLNAVYEGIRAYEARTGERFEIIVTHDAEDIIHPLALLVFNYLVPRKDMIQLPVFPLAVPLRQVTHWTYADEFAAGHLRELPVREFIGGFVPSAGVGTAYTRRAFELVWMVHGGEVFPEGSLTEDYALGLRLRLAGLDTAAVVVQVPVPRRRGDHHPKLSRWVATWATFPRTLEAAIRQKTRWSYGIALQSWATDGWPGPPAVQYNLLHDRKVVATSPASLLGYAVLLWAAFHELVLRRVDPARPALVEPGTLLWSCIMVSTGLMVWRLGQRVAAVWQIYGAAAALSSIPRAAWANYINFVALVRAVRQYLRMRRTGTPPAWDKTPHEFFPAPHTPAVPATAGPEDLPKAVPPRRPRRWNALETITAEWDEAALLLLERDLRREDGRIVLESLHRIPRAHGARFLPVVAGLTRAGAWQIRARACRVVGFFGLPRAAAELAAAARDRDWVVRANAVRALGKLGDEGERVLLELLAGPDRDAREAALSMLEQSGAAARHASRLRDGSGPELARAQHFFQILEVRGPSPLARVLLRRVGRTAGSAGIAQVPER